MTVEQYNREKYLHDISNHPRVEEPFLRICHTCEALKTSIGHTQIALLWVLT